MPITPRGWVVDPGNPNKFIYTGRIDTEQNSTFNFIAKSLVRPRYAVVLDGSISDGESLVEEFDSSIHSPSDVIGVVIDSKESQQGQRVDVLQDELRMENGNPPSGPPVDLNDTSVVTQTVTVGNEIAEHDDGTGNLVPIIETVTEIDFDTTTGEITYTDENGAETDLDLTSLTKVSEVTQTVTVGNEIAIHEDGDGNTVSILETVTDISFDTTTNELTYNDEDGNANDIDLSSLDNTSIVTATVTSGNQIATHQDGDSTLVNIFETVTSLNINTTTNVLSYVDEAGVIKNIDLTYLLDDTNLPRIISGVLDPNTCILTLTRDDGSTFTIDLTKDILQITDQDGDTFVNVDNGSDNDTITFQTGGNQAATFTDTQVCLAGYPNTRDNSGSIPPVNFLYTDGSGCVQSAPFPKGCELVPITRAALVSLEGSSNLDICSVYRITDNAHPFTGNVYVRALDINKLPHQVYFDAPSVSNELLVGEYDFDGGRFHRLRDSVRDITVEGDASIASFPWGNGNITSGFVRNSTLNFTAGRIFGFRIEDSSTVTITGGTHQNLKVLSRSVATLSRNTNEVVVEGESSLTTGGTGTANEVIIENDSTVRLGNTNILQSEFRDTLINTIGSSGQIRSSKFFNVNGNALTNIPSLNILESTYSDSHSFSCSNASRIYLYRSSGTGGATRYLVSANGRLDASQTSLKSNSYIQVTNGSMLCYYADLAANSYIRHFSSGLNYIYGTNLRANSRAEFYATSNNNRIYYSNIAANSYVQINGTNTLNYIYGCDVGGNSRIRAINSNNSRMYYCTAHGNSEIYSQNNPQLHYMYYCTGRSNGFVQAVNNSQRFYMYGIASSAQSIARLQNSTAQARWYYSSYTAYFYHYMTLTNTTARQAYHGYGRRSYTVTNPVPTTGAFVQNF